MSQPAGGADAGVSGGARAVWRPHSPGLQSALIGRSLTTARRRSKSIWLQISGTADLPVPGPELGIHLGMSGRIVITGPDGAVAEGGDPLRYDTRPRRAAPSGALSKSVVDAGARTPRSRHRE